MFFVGARKERGEYESAKRMNATDIYLDLRVIIWHYYFGGFSCLGFGNENIPIL